MRLAVIGRTSHKLILSVAAILLTLVVTSSHCYASGLKNEKSLNIREEGTSQGDVKALNFVGSTTTATVSNGVATITSTGGSGGGMSIDGAISNSPNTNSVLFVGPGGVLSQDTSFIYDVTTKTLQITAAGVDAITTLSGASSSNSTAGIGRTAIEGRWAISGSANQYSVGAKAGDFVIRHDTLGQKLMLGTGGNPTIILSDDNASVGITDQRSKLTVSSDSATKPSLEVGMVTSQTANLTNWVNQARVVKASISPDGAITSYGDGRLVETGSGNTAEWYIDSEGSAQIVVDRGGTSAGRQAMHVFSTAGTAQFYTGLVGSVDQWTVMDEGSNVMASFTDNGSTTTGRINGTLQLDSSTDGGLLIGKGAAAITNTGVLAKGTLVVGDGATDPTTLTVGANGTILSADSSTASGLAWVTAPTPGGTGHKVFINYQVQSAKLSNDNSVRIDAGLQGGATNYTPWRLFFEDGTTNPSRNIALFQGRMDDNWDANTLTAKIDYGMLSSDSTSTAGGSITFGVSIWAITSGDSALITTESFDTENTKTQEVPTVISRDATVSIPITNADSLAPGDWFMVKLRRVGTDSITGDAGVVSFAVTQ